MNTLTLEPGFMTEELQNLGKGEEAEVYVRVRGTDRPGQFEVIEAPESHDEETEETEQEAPNEGFQGGNTESDQPEAMPAIPGPVKTLLGKRR